MYATYGRLRKLADLYEGDLEYTNEALIEATMQYQQTENPQAFAFVFCRVFKVTVTITKYWPMLTDQEKESCSMEMLHRAMMTYQENNRPSVQYWYGDLLKKQLYTLVEAKGYKKRKANNGAMSYEEEAVNFEGENDKRFDMVETLQILKGLGLTKNEFTYCQEVVNNTGNPIKDVDLVEKLGISGPAINQMKKRLRVKLQPLLV